MVGDPFFLSGIILAGIAGLLIGRLLSARIIGTLLLMFFSFLVLKLILELLQNPEAGGPLLDIQENLSLIIMRNGTAVLVFLAGLFIGLSRRRRRS